MLNRLRTLRGRLRLRTLRGRLTALALAAATVVVIVVVAGFNVVLADSLDRDVTSRLRTQAAAAATTVSVVDGVVRVRESPDDEAIDAQVWVFQGRRAVVRPPGGAAVQRAADALAARGSGTTTVGDPGVRLHALPITRGGRQVGTVVAGQSLAAYDRTTDIALVASTALAVVLLAGVYLVTWLTIGRALAPVREMTRSAAAWSENDRERRFGPAERPDELGELAETFDALLDRLGASLRHEQRLSAELSHELRTPLARIVAEIELLRRRERSAEERDDAYAVVERSAQQMHRILETLMTAARAESGGGQGRSVVDRSLDAIEREWHDGDGRGREVGLDVVRPEAPLAVGADAEVVERILSPLLDNARRHAASRVVVDAARAGGRVIIRVHDDGPGVAPEERDAIFLPGRQASVVRGHDGAGLGLALARRLARTAGGDVVVRDADDGPGSVFVVDLPG